MRELFGAASGTNREETTTMNTAHKGRALEHQIRHLLEADGWQVIRGAGSKGAVLDWKADLLASKWTDQTKREVWLALIQCKVKKR